MLRRLLAGAALLAASQRAIAQVPESEYAARRDSVVTRLGDGIVLALGAREPEEDYLTFVQAPRFYYLTGFREPDATLVIVRRGGATTSTMFVNPRDPARETWTGTRWGTDGVTQRTGMIARPNSELAPALDSLLRGGRKLYVIGVLNTGSVRTADDQYVDQLRAGHPKVVVEIANGLIDRMRSRHSPAELALLRKAIDITVMAQREAMRTVRPGLNEFEVQALLEYTFRRNGADRPAFATIVGSGPNSLALHYNADDRFMSAGEVVVMDIGASYRGYAADVTRTIPVSGTFSPEQRALYQVVRDAQAAAERQARLGGTAQAMEDSANAALTAGLARLGLIESENAVFDPGRAGCRRRLANGCSQLSLYYPHGLGHGIGLEVHDPNPWLYQPGTIVPGSAFTIEPGLYINATTLDNLPDTPRNRAMLGALRATVERFKDTGVRIEDNYFATEQGVEWISRAPRELDEVEAAMKERSADLAKRDSAVVDWYRATADPR
ncbi:MAG TPA: Xaa-Pro peptidase family protein [Gemmatimonadaceae bacterium]|nr:Xaa-Pro peptidase family protein [Gemmatimonadaceae bacterium]